MAERPILFSAPMVRALLDGRKTQTRRVVKPQPYIDERGNVCVPNKKGGATMYGQHPDGRPQWDSFKRWRCPYGVPGDLLWVRESHAIVPRSAYARSDGVQQTLHPDDDHDAAVYAEGWERSRPGRWRPSIHMPRWASRITLRVTDVRVERLQDISEADALAEGVDLERCCGVPSDACGTHLGGCCGQPEAIAPIDAYRDLWNHINGPGSWDANPWVWCVAFEVVR